MEAIYRKLGDFVFSDRRNFVFPTPTDKNILCLKAIRFVVEDFKGFRWWNITMKTLADITPQFIRSHYGVSAYNGKEISVFTFDNPKYYICTGIKKPLLCSTISITRHCEGSVTVRLFGPIEERGGFRREDSCVCTTLFYDKRIVDIHDLYVNLRTFIFSNSNRSVLREPTSKPTVGIKNTERFLNS